MAFSKAGAWYERVLKPLRRLTSATSNSMPQSPQAQHQQRTAPRCGEVDSPNLQRVEETCKSFDRVVQDRYYIDTIRQPGNQPGAKTKGEHTTMPKFSSTFAEKSLSAQKTQRFRFQREYRQNPLDILLNDSHTSAHPVRLFSHSVNRPFSTSAADQARRQPPKQKSVVVPSRSSVGGRHGGRQAGKPGSKSRGSGGTGGSPTRQTRVGSKKHRKSVQGRSLGEIDNSARGLRTHNLNASRAIPKASVLESNNYEFDRKNLQEVSFEGSVSGRGRVGVTVSDSALLTRYSDGKEIKATKSFSSEAVSESIYHSLKSKELKHAVCYGNDAVNDSSLKETFGNNKKRDAIAQNDYMTITGKPSVLIACKICAAKESKKMLTRDVTKRAEMNPTRICEVPSEPQGFRCNLWKRAFSD